MEIDQDNLRTEIAIGCHASHEHCSNYLYTYRVNGNWLGYERAVLATQSNNQVTPWRRCSLDEFYNIARTVQQAVCYGCS